jgi:hypothetical protein
MKIELKQLGLINFKGIRQLVENFEPAGKSISEPNRGGKTTRVDAFLWLLFDKDSNGRSDFEVKTLDANNRVINHLDHEVNAILMVDGVRNDLRKVLQEKWTKPRGQAEEVLSGNETSYYWNDVPLKKGEYQAKIASLVSEELFKAITNPLHFNVKLKWEERRGVLIKMAGTISNAMVLDKITTPDNKHRMAALLDVLTSGKTTTDYRRELLAKKNRIKAELESIPARIDEAERSKPDFIDVKAIEKELAGIRQQIAVIDEALQTGTAAQQERRNKVNNAARVYDDAVLKVRQVERQIEQQYNDLIAKQGTGTRELEARQARVTGEKKLVETDLQTTVQRIERLNNSLAITRQAWKDENAKTFNEVGLNLATSCAACHQPLPEERVQTALEAARQQYAAAKADKLADLREQGKRDGVTLDNLNKQAENLTARHKVLVAELLDIADQIKAENEKPKEAVSLDDLKAESTDLLAAVTTSNEAKATMEAVNAEPVDTSASDAYQTQKISLKAREMEDVSAIAKAGELPRIEARIAELTTQLQNQNQELADLEAAEFSVQQFEKEYMGTVEKRVNEMFRTIKFKLFEQQINGGEKPTCEALINGVPYSDANNAAKINAGLEIINVLCRHYNVYAPIFVDNAEAVNEFVHVDSQIIKLFVSPPGYDAPKNDPSSLKSIGAARQVVMFEE